MSRRKRAPGASDWEDAAPPAQVQQAIDDPDAAKVSLIYAAIRLQRDGLSAVDIASVLGISTYKVTQALRDPRAQIVARRLEADQGAPDALEAAQAAYRLSRAWEVLDLEMDSKDVWIRHQAALAVIAAAQRKSEMTGGRTEIVISADLDFDDQADQSGPDMQDDHADDAIPGNLMVVGDD